MHIRSFLAAALAAASGIAHAENAAPAPKPAAAPADAGIHAYLKPASFPGVPASCASPVEQGMVKLPLFASASAECPVAHVAGDYIRLGELTDSLAASHETRPGAGGGPARPHDMDFAPALGRLIDVRLLAAEARAMGLEDLPENKADIDEFKASSLRVLLQREVTKEAKPDPAEVDRIFKDTVRQWKVKSVLFAKEEDAKKLVEQVKAGKSFDELAKQAVADKKAKGGDVETIAARGALPQIAAAASKLKPGGVSGAIVAPGGAVVMRLEAVLYPEDAKARADAEKRSLGLQQAKAVRKFYDSLVKRYATVDRALLKRLDFEAKKPGFAALEKDPRPIATIQGEKPLTVADLAKGLADKFFHGIEGPIKENKVNVAKVQTFEQLLGVRLFAKEAAARKLQDREDYQRGVEEHRRAVAFGSFLEKVIVADIRVDEIEAKRYFDQHQSEFTYPAAYRLEGLAFGSAKEAQAALGKLRSGTDYAWMRANAEGQLKPEQRSLRLDGIVITSTNLPAELAKALTGAKQGDYRLYSAGAQHYVVRVIDARPPKVQDYQEAREAIGKKLFTEKVGKAVRDYADKLRKVQPVEVLITRIGS